MTDQTITDQIERRPHEADLPFSLIVLYAPAEGVPVGTERTLSSTPLVLARSGDGPGTFALRDRRVSRLHATLVASRGSVLLRDQSTNGTYVEGARVERATLEDGAVLRVGDTLLMARRQRDEPDEPIDELWGRAPAMRTLRRMIAMVAPAAASVLVSGASGTGKELVARAIHARSGLRGQLVAINCAAIPDTLADSHLFGHVAGSFTGARSDHDGVLRRAHEGTLFLDEIAEMPLPSQAKLLRALEERSVTPLGGSKALPARVRVIAATHRSLREAVERGEFRGDLYARIADITLTTPPLRERREDVLPLLGHFLDQHSLAQHTGGKAPELHVDLAEALLVHPWTFNVRELQKVAAELALRGRGSSLLELRLIEARLAEERACVQRSAPSSPTSPATLPPAAREEDPALDDEPPDDARIREVYDAHRGNVSAMARTLGRSRRQVRRYLARLGLREEPG